MINFEFEELLTLREAVGKLPGSRAGKRPHINTIRRWAAKGTRGVVLETLLVGGTRCTSLQALQRFFAQLSAQDADKPMPPERRRVRTLQVSEDTLRSAGILSEGEPAHG